MTDEEFAKRNAVLNDEMTRNQAIILQSNTRASGIAQLLAAVLTLIGVATALVVALGNTKMSFAVTAFAWVAVVGLLVSLFGLVSVKWPRLGKMPRDRTAMGFKQRINDVAEAHGNTDVLDYEQGFYVQQIVFVKERSTQVALVGMLVLSVSAVVAFGLMLFS